MTDPPERPQRDRLRLVVAALIVIPLGLLTRTDFPLPALVLTYGGDTLYATLVYLLVALVWLRQPTWRLSLLALTICFAVELSQLIQTPWLNALRTTLPGRLVLGAGFLWSDLACYGAGVLLGVALDLALRPRPTAASGYGR
jgi:hypothetical protein